MAPAEVLIIAVILLFILLACGMPIALVLGLTSITGLVLVGGPALLIPVSNILYSAINSFVIVAVPLFLLMGEIIFICGMGSELYEVASKWTGKLPGGLAMGSTLACAVFGAMCGAGVAGAAAIGVVAIPEMRRRGYGPSLFTGTVAAAGGLAMLIPPSIPVILYAAVTEASVGRLFAACMVPGIILSLLMCVYIGIAVKTGWEVAPAGYAVTWRERFWSLRRVWTAVVLIMLVLGSIYTGFATPTEAAGVGAFGALLLALFVYRRLNWSTFAKALFQATKTTSMVLLLVASALVFGYLLTWLQVPQMLIGAVLQAEVPLWIVLLIINLLFFVLGMFVDIGSAILVGVPVVLPVATALGIDIVWLGVIIAINMLMAFITPPVGLGLYVIKGLAPDVPITTIIRGALPFIICEAIAIALVIVYPQIALWLPGKLF